jgi:hypothetical protein
MQMATVDVMDSKHMNDGHQYVSGSENQDEDEMTLVLF